jgi:hypothetical protein
MTIQFELWVAERNPQLSPTSCPLATQDGGLQFDGQCIESLDWDNQADKQVLILQCEYVFTSTAKPSTPDDTLTWSGYCLSRSSWGQVADALIKLNHPNGGYLPDINLQTQSAYSPSDIKICGEAFTVQVRLLFTYLSCPFRSSQWFKSMLIRGWLRFLLQLFFRGGFRWFQLRILSLLISHNIM